MNKRTANVTVAMRVTQTARAIAFEEAAKYHDDQAAYWQELVVSACKRCHGDEADATEARAQHERYCAYRIMHEQSARLIREKR